MQKTEANSSKPIGVTVQRRLVLPPVVLQALLPEVASVVKGAMSTSNTQVQRPKVPELQQDTLKEPQTARGILNPFPCNICKQRLPSRETLNWHQLEHFSQCHHCKKCFDSKSQLLTHKCSVSYASNMRREDKHYQLSPYTCKTDRVNTRLQKLPSVKLSKELNKCKCQCQTCKRRFLIKSDFIEHQKNTKPCKYCERCIKNLDQSTHQLFCVENVKSRTRFKCKMCGDQFDEKFSLTSHVRTHKTPVKSYSRKPKVATLLDMGKNTQSQTRPEDSAIETCKKGTDEINYEKFLKEAVKKELHNINEKNENIIDNETQFVIVKDETELIDNLKTSEIDSIKVEHSEFQIVSPEARKTLYEGHHIQGEMVLGPMIVQNPNIVYSKQNDLQNKTSCKNEPTNGAPISDPLFIRPCPVKKEPSEPLENKSTDRMPCKQEPADDTLISDKFVGLRPIKEEMNEFSLENESLLDRKPDVYSIKAEHFVVANQ